MRKRASIFERESTSFWGGRFSQLLYVTGSGEALPALQGVYNSLSSHVVIVDMSRAGARLTFSELDFLILYRFSHFV
jgi:hypothetical protein